MGRAPQPPPQRGVRVALVSDAELAVADEVEQDHRARLGERGRGNLATAQALLLEVAGGVARRLLAVEEDEVNRVARPPDRARELGGDGRAGRAVVRAHEAP